MTDWFHQLWASITVGRVLLGVCLFLLTFVVSYVAVSVILVKLPATYFHSDHEHHLFPDRNPMLRGVAIVVKNVLGVILIVTGIILSLPGVPGPGLLTVFIGIMLTDVPGKRVLESKIIGRPSVLAAINKLRAKYNKPALILD